MLLWLRPHALAGVLLILAMACGGSGRAPPSPAASPAAPSSTTSPTPSPPPTVGEGPHATVFAAEAGDLAGTIIAGDFNGDGVNDLLLAAAAADGPSNTRPDGGEAYIFLGPFVPSSKRDTAAGEFDVVIHGAQPGDQLGRAAAAGDINGDGFDDIALAAPFASPDDAREQAGIVYVLYGSESLGREVRSIDLDADAADAVALGADAGDLAGFALATADLDADGAADLLIGAFSADGPDNAREEAGEAYVLFGRSLRARTNLALGEQDATIYGADAGDRLGWAVAGGDLDGDGQADFVIGAPVADGPDEDREAAGEVYVILSPTPRRLDMAIGTPALTVVGADPGDQLGHALASGDANGDGADDLWLAALSADGPNNEADLAGEAHLVLGGPDLPSLIDTAAGEATTTVYGSFPEARLGRSVAAFDIDRDGLSDLIIAAPNVEGFRGAVYVISGQTDADRYPRTTAGAALVVTGQNPRDTLGHDVFGVPALSAGDMDGDGRPELLAAAPTGDGDQNDRPDAGEAYIIFFFPP